MVACAPRGPTVPGISRFEARQNVQNRESGGAPGPAPCQDSVRRLFLATSSRCVYLYGVYYKHVVFPGEVGSPAVKTKSLHRAEGFCPNRHSLGRVRVPRCWMASLDSILSGVLSIKSYVLC